LRSSRLWLWDVTEVHRYLRGLKYGWSGHLDYANQPDHHSRLCASGHLKTRLLLFPHQLFSFFKTLPLIR
jgi:hypothetical protein